MASGTYFFADRFSVVLTQGHTPKPETNVETDDA